MTMTTHSAARRLEPGTVLDGTFKVLCCIGDGATGTVYEALDLRRAEERVAVKVLAVDPSMRADALSALEGDLERLAALKHPNIVAAQLWRRGGAPLLIVDLLQGEDLQRRLRAGLLPVEVADAIVAQVGAALAAAHRSGVAHHALKPSNVFLARGPEDAGEVVRVLDFGVWRVARKPWTLTSAETARTSAPYLAPEQIHATAVAGDVAVDQYALATIAYELYGGRPAFAGDSVPAVLIAVTQREPAPLREVNPRVSARRAEAIRRGMAGDPGERFPDVEAFVAALLGKPVARRATASRRAAMAAAAIGAAALVGTGVWLVLGAHETRSVATSEAVDAGAAALSIAPSAAAVDGGVAQQEVASVGAIDEDFAEGVRRVGAGDCRAAVVHFEKALARDASSVDAHYYLGVCYAALGRERDGALHYEEVLHRQPNHPSAAKLRAILREYFQRTHEAPRWPL